MLLWRPAPLGEHPLPLEPAEVAAPTPSARELLVRVSVCGVCRTDLDLAEGRLAAPTYPLIPGHQVVGRVAGAGAVGWRSLRLTNTTDEPPEPLAAIVDTTPAWKPVVEALGRLAPGGRLVINAIRKESGDQHELLRLDYATHLWREREIKSVANVARADVREFLQAAAEMDLRPTVTEVPLSEANAALAWLRSGDAIRGARVLRVAQDA